MGCCILGAILITQFLTAWRARRHLFMAAAVALIASGVLAYQYAQHAHHIHQFLWDMQALARGEDPAVAALAQPQLRCSANGRYETASRQ